MGFFKKLFTGIGFAAGFLFFGCLSVIVYTGMSYVIPWSSIPKDLQESLHRYVSEAEGKLCGYCKEELCNSESGRRVVELYLGKQDGHGSRILY
jgi:hypothetical protein